MMDIHVKKNKMETSYFYIKNIILINNDTNFMLK